MVRDTAVTLLYPNHVLINPRRACAARVTQLYCTSTVLVQYTCPVHVRTRCVAGPARPAHQLAVRIRRPHGRHGCAAAAMPPAAKFKQ